MFERHTDLKQIMTFVVGLVAVGVNADSMCIDFVVLSVVFTNPTTS